MAGDWIKIRSSLRKDPHVLAIADYLSVQRAFMDWLTDPVKKHCERDAYEHVTRDVTVRVTMCALVDVWAMANETGKPDGDDLMIAHCTLSAIDDIAGIPCFGAAMESVDWASEVSAGRGKKAIRLPKFLMHNTPAGERAPTSAAERQRRYRERKALEALEADPKRRVLMSDEEADRDANGDATRDVTAASLVTPREEKSREEQKNIQAPGFSDFWEAWPKSLRKGARSECEKVWKTGKLDKNAAEIVAHVRVLAKSPGWKKQGGEFIPAPVVYLRGRRWDGAELDLDAGFGDESPDQVAL